MTNAEYSWALVGVIAALTALWFVFRLGNSLPLLIHNSAWIVSIFLVGTGLIAYKPQSVDAWLLLLTGIASFNFGAFVAQLGLKVKPPRYRFVSSHSFAHDSLMSRKSFYFLFCLHLLGFLTYLWVIETRFGIESLIFDPGSVRGYKGEISYLESVPVVARVMIALGPTLFAAALSSRGVSHPFSKPVKMLLTTYFVVSMLALLQRTNLTMALGLLACAGLLNFYFSRQAPKTNREKRRELVRLGLLGIGLLTILVIVFQGLALALGKTQTNFYPAITKPLNDSGFAAIVSYSAGGTAAFLELTQSKNSLWPQEASSGEYVEGDYNPQTFGAALALPILKIFPITRPWPQISPFIDVGMPVNVFTWLEPWYRDFRLLGLILGPMAIGALSIIMLDRRGSSPVYFWVSAFLMLSTAFAPFTFKLYDTIVLVGFVVITLFGIPWRQILRPTARELG